MPSQMGERHHEPDNRVAAHAEHADVVKEDDACDTARLVRFAEERADEYIGAARFVDDGGAEGVESLAKDPGPIGERTGVKTGTAVNDHRVGSPPVCESTT